MEIKRDSKLTVEVNPALHGKWKTLATRVDSLAGIVQNDIEITGAQLEEFVKYCGEAKKQLAELEQKTIKHIMACQT